MNEMHKIAAAVDEYLTPFIESIILQAKRTSRLRQEGQG